MNNTCTREVEMLSQQANLTINLAKLPHGAAKKDFQVEPVAAPSGGSAYRFVKRTLDIVVSAVALLIAGVPMALIAVWVRLDSPGPALYRQERLGLNGKSFWIYKFRSMRVDAEANGAQWAEEHDDRVTRAGRFLRKTRLDELPQLLNILRGQMSLVGPRPERPCFYAEFEKYIHGFSQRMVVKPGLTGLAQVSGGYDLLPEEKIQFDMQYIRERSIALDLKCILRTIGVVFDHNGAR